MAIIKIILFAFIYILAAAFVSREARNRHLGAKKGLYYSLLLTPLIGLIITLLSTRYDNSRYRELLRAAGTARLNGNPRHARSYYRLAAGEYAGMLTLHPKLDTQAARAWLKELQSGNPNIPPAAG